MQWENVPSKAARWSRGNILGSRDRGSRLLLPDCPDFPLMSVAREMCWFPFFLESSRISLAKTML